MVLGSSSGVRTGFSPSLIVVLAQVREFIRLDPSTQLFLSSHVPESPLPASCRQATGRKGGEEQGHATPKSGNALHREASGATVRPLPVPFHPRLPSDGSKEMRPLSTCAIHGLPRRAWSGSGASRHPNIEPCGHWAPACPAVRVGRGFMLVACAVAAASSASGCSVAATLAAWERRWGEGDRLMALRNGTKVAPSAWRLCIQLVGAGRTTHRKRSWPIDKPGPPATTRRDRRRPRK